MGDLSTLANSPGQLSFMYWKEEEFKYQGRREE